MESLMHIKTLPDNPYDGHTLRDVIEDSSLAARSSAAMSTRGIAVTTQRPRAGSSSRDNGAGSSASSNVNWRRRSAIEPVIGHLKAEGHLGRCYLKGRAGDTANAILSAVGYNFRRNPRMAEDSFAPSPARDHATFNHSFSAQSRLLTDD